MAVDFHIRDGEGSKKTAKVSRVGPTDRRSNALHVHIADIETEVAIPVTTSAIGIKFDSQFTLNGDGVTYDCSVNGSVTPQNFYILADPVYDILISEIVIYGLDSGIKLANFLGENSPLTNGCLLEIKDDDKVTTFRPIKRTADINMFSSAGGFTLNVESAADNARGVRVCNPAFVIRKQGTFAVNDYAKFMVRDNISTVVELQVIARGAKLEVGTI